MKHKPLYKNELDKPHVILDKPHVIYLNKNERMMKRVRLCSKGKLTIDERCGILPHCNNERIIYGRRCKGWMCQTNWRANQ